MSRPSKFKAQCFTYKINWHNSSSGDHGETCTDSKEILIKNNIKEEIAKETLCHEVCHVLCEDLIELITAAVRGDMKDEDVEEKLIRLLSPRMMQVFKDNPSLTRYLYL